MIERGNPLFAVTQVTGQTSDLKECSIFLNNVDRYLSNVQMSHQEALLYVVCRQRSSDQDDYQGKKSDNETCFQNPQSYW